MSALSAERASQPLHIRVGYELVYQCPKPTPMIVTLSVHHSRVSDLIKPDHLMLNPSSPITAYRDSFGNWCSRIVAPAGRLRPPDRTPSARSDPWGPLNARERTSVAAPTAGSFPPRTIGPVGTRRLPRLARTLPSPEALGCVRDDDGSPAPW